ncbi:MAG: Verru_Chthon cassette protein A, partial [Chthoniobacterales bacterium]
MFNYDATGGRTIYKLYSAQNMIVESPSGDPFSEDLPPSGGDFTLPERSYSARWADLNTPVVVSSIGGSTPIFPIVNPLASETVNGVPPVEGFEIVDPGAVDGIVSGAADPESARLPMPVNWLYLTGTNVSAPGPGGSNTSVNVPGATGPTSQVIGRIAFWTDDDTCKINFNTAGGDRWEDYADADLLPTAKGFGSYWDVPLGASVYEASLARSQPWNGEFQRYPGHPASVYLSAVFPDLTAQQISDLVPRITYGDETGNTGSKSGTRFPDLNTLVNADRLKLDRDRLYASLDELLYAENRSEQTDLAITAERLETAKFFTTARSSAPELTLFGTPRIAIWPVHSVDDEDHRTVFDRLIAFCATIPNGPTTAQQKSYFFQRADSDSPTNDYDLIARNQELYGYLQRLTSSAIPGFGAAFVPAAYAVADRDQTLTQIFDYIRSTNLLDAVLALEEGGVPFTDHDLTALSTLSGAGQVTPIRIEGNSTMGFGRFPTVSEVGLLFIANGESPRTDFGGRMAETPSDDDKAELKKISVPNAPDPVESGRQLEEMRRRSAGTSFVKANNGGDELAGHDASHDKRFNP